MKTILVFLSLFVSVQQTQTVGEKIVAYSLENMNKQVDRGECWDLAAAALKQANAKWSAPFNFGTAVDWKKQGLKPGDILQFTEAKLYGKSYSMYFPQHTAIIYKSMKNKVTVFHQNYNNKRAVDTLTMNLADLKSGKIEAYRPVSK